MKKQIITAQNAPAAMKVSRDKIRESFKRGSDTIKVNLEDIVVLEGWNDRIDFGDIPELAEGIVANEGTEPIFGKILEDKRFQLIDGERRHMAYLHIKEYNLCDAEWTNYMIAFPATADHTELDMMYKKGTANNGKPFTAFEEAHYFQSLMDMGQSQAEIAKRLGHNRMHVSNRIALNTATAIEREFVEDKTISVTELTKLIKAIPDIVKRSNYLFDAAKRPDLKINVEKDLERQGYQIDEDGNLVKPDEVAKEPKSNFEDDTENTIVDDIKGIESGAYTKEPNEVTSIPDGLDQGGINNIGTETTSEPESDKNEPDTVFNRNGRGLAALLSDPAIKNTHETNEPPLDEPHKPARLTINKIITDEGSSLGNTEVITGSVSEAIKMALVQLKAIDRQVKHDGKLADASLLLDQYLRYIQKIIKSRPDIANLEWDDKAQMAVEPVQ